MRIKEVKIEKESLLRPLPEKLERMLDKGHAETTGVPCIRQELDSVEAAQEFALQDNRGAEEARGETCPAQRASQIEAFSWRAGIPPNGIQARGKAACQQRDDRLFGERRIRSGIFEQDAFRRQLVDERRRIPIVSICAEMIRSKRIDGNQNNMGRLFFFTGTENENYKQKDKQCGCPFHTLLNWNLTF
jgi:hypothetical protein